ncbi:MAG: formate--tetrahydrofolate ligase [Gammaproteobacteria bacterium]|nr:formate--tetrahydrofolate ligase [Acidimicrobiia bacterium]MYC60554.1 formate--tetrahydrofolate ligase [Gammaproteobacteria bacterium]
MSPGGAQTVRPDIEIARSAEIRPVAEVAASLGIPFEALDSYGQYKAKLSLDYIDSLQDRPDGKLILVTGINPTPAGEGKSTTLIGLHDALQQMGQKSIACLREPSLGPCFGMKGGATGGGYAQVMPMDDINLHFTGDFHAIGAANNLLAAMLDNHLYWGNSLLIDERRIQFRRALDMNDRALRAFASSAVGVSRTSGFDIVAASEVMAIFCLADSMSDLGRRLGNIVIASDIDERPVFGRDIEAAGAMTVLLRDAFAPNMVQTLENNPALVHGGPFANIAHGCNSVMATRAGLKLADYVITEAGFGADLGAEKFFDIKCRSAGLEPAAAVVVATVRALKMHGGVAREDLDQANPAALEAGMANLLRHVENVRKFNLPAVVALNQFSSDTEEEIEAVRRALAGLDVEVSVCTHWAEGGRGALDLAQKVRQLADSGGTDFKPLYPDDLSFEEKIRTVAREVYRAGDVEIPDAVRERLRQWEAMGRGHLPICIAKTPYSFSTDPEAKGAPSGHTLPVRDVRLFNGAEFVVVITGDILTMPGLPFAPAARDIALNEDGEIVGLF